MNKNFIENCTFSLLNWIEKSSYSSYDHYDYFASKFGIFSKKLFRAKKIAAFPFLSLIFLLDNYFPQSRRIFAKKSQSAEVIPRIATGYFRLFKIASKSGYLDRGCRLLGWLRNHACSTEHGIGWGLHFDWQGRVFIPKQTPCVTLTAYATEAFLDGYRFTGRKDYLDMALKTSDFVAYDLNRRKNGAKTALSYTPIDQNFVINANSYAAKILANMIQYRENRMKRDLIEEIVNYILSQQNPDGSWYYFDREDVPEKMNFIDSFHTCFVIENLFLIWRWNKDERVKSAIDKGYKFFVDHFITDEFSVRYYYSYPYHTGVKVDIRGCAEAIHCLALLSEVFADSLDLSIKITRWTINNMQDKDGYFYFRIYETHKHKMPYMRWGQAPMFNALTLLLSKLNS